MFTSVRSANQLEQFEVIDLGLEDIFKDYIRGAQNAGSRVLS